MCSENIEAGQNLTTLELSKISIAGEEKGKKIEFKMRLVI